MKPWHDTRFLFSDQSTAFKADPERIAAKAAYDDALQRWYDYAAAHPGERTEWGMPLPDWAEYLDAYLENLDRAERAAYQRAGGVGPEESA